MKNSIKLTVFFENAFWVGVFEKYYGTKYEVCKITFGSEPKDYDIYYFILQNLNKLKFSSTIDFENKLVKKINPKKLQKKIKEETKNKGIGTKAQNALKLQHEENKIRKKQLFKKKKELEKDLKFKLKQEKKLKKHKGH